MMRKMAILLFAACSVPASAQNKSASPLLLIDPNQAAQKVAAQARAQKTDAPADVDQEALIRRYGNIIDGRPIGAGGLTAWTVEKNGRRVVLYTTADGGAIISGVVWDTSGRNLSDQLASVAAPAPKPPAAATGAPAAHTAAPAVPAVVSNAAPAAAPAAARVGALVGKYSGAVPESIKAVDSLAGIKEGKGGVADTLYVVFDPRCPYCRKAYNFTRDYVKRGFTIKWIPAVVLGNPPEGNALAATILQAKPGQQAEVLQRVLGNKEQIATPPNKATTDQLERNAAFFFAAFQNNRVQQVGVPAAFFMDKHTGKPRMMMGISELPVIEEVFGKL